MPLSSASPGRRLLGGRRGRAGCLLETPRLRLVCRRPSTGLHTSVLGASARSNVSNAEQATDHFDALLNHHDLLGYGPSSAVTARVMRRSVVFGPWKPRQASPTRSWCSCCGTTSTKGRDWPSSRVSTRRFRPTGCWRADGRVPIVSDGNRRATNLAVAWARSAMAAGRRPRGRPFRSGAIPTREAHDRDMVAICEASARTER